MSSNVILFGLGKMGYLYDAENRDNNVVLTHFSAIKESLKLNLVAIIETDSNRHKHLHKEFSSLLYADVNQIEITEKIDLVVIATPSKTHLEVVRAALKLSPRVILLEKPVANTLPDALEIFNLASESGVQIFINYQRNYHHEFRNLALDISQGRTQGPFVFTGWFNNGWLNNCSHLLALYLGLFPNGFDDLKISANNEDLLAWKTSDGSAQFINLKDFDGAFFSFELICKNRTYRYDSHFNTLRISELTQSQFFPKENSLSFPELSIDMNESNMLREVYGQLENYLSGSSSFTFSLEKGVMIVKLLSDLMQNRENGGSALGI